MRSRVVGRAYLWTPNTRHPLLRALGDLFRGEEDASAGLVLLVLKHLASSGGLRRIAIFGSAARGEEGPQSDLDLFVLVESATSKRLAEERLARLKEEAQGKFGTRVRPQVFTMREYERKRALPLIQAIDREGRPVHFAGESA